MFGLQPLVLNNDRVARKKAHSPSRSPAVKSVDVKGRVIANQRCVILRFTGGVVASSTFDLSYQADARSGFDFIGF